ncbi:MAG: hypothetical protein JNN23_15320 [Chryseobacterium gambrini]|nr:hypothetical protein [Chryseobacterium gambrini]
MDINNYFEFEYLKELFLKKIKKSKSKGIDKVSIETFEKKLDENLRVLKRKVLNGSYEFSPYLEILKLKGRNKVPRVISIPTIRDKMVLLVIKEILHNVFDSDVNRKLPNNYIKDVKKYLEANSGEKFYLKLDLEKFYDTIDRKILLTKLNDKNLPDIVIDLINKAILTITIPPNTKKNSYVNYKSDIGIPQGLSISNILAQIYVLDFDKTILKRKYFYRRYVDDILLINNTPFSSFRIDNFSAEIEKLGLHINQEKTEQNSLNNFPFTFLSYNISNLNISIAEKNVELFIRRIAGKFTWFKNGINNTNKRPEYLKDDTEKFKTIFLEELNESITGTISNKKNYGWLFYFSEITDINLLFRLDKIISSFFTDLDSFNNVAPKELKKLTRTFYSIKHKKFNYICNFDIYDSIRKKRDFLLFRGQISQTRNYTDEEIDFKFENFQQKQIYKLEKDLGYKYF